MSATGIQNAGSGRRVCVADLKVSQTCITDIPDVQPARRAQNPTLRVTGWCSETRHAPRSAEPGRGNQDCLELHDERAAIVVDRRPDGIQ